MNKTPIWEGWKMNLEIGDKVRVTEYTSANRKRAKKKTGNITGIYKDFITVHLFVDLEMGNVEIERVNSNAAKQPA